MFSSVYGLVRLIMDQICVMFVMFFRCLRIRVLEITFHFIVYLSRKHFFVFYCINCGIIGFFSYQLQALTQDGKNPDEYVFENSPKKRENPTAPGNGVAEEDENSTNDTSTVVEAEVNATEVPPAKIAKIEAAVESTEPEPERKPEVKEEQKEEKKKENEEKKEEKKEEKEEPEQENEQDEDQLTVVDSDKIDSNTLDNDDSLNLTIGEDEAKIFQDEVCISSANFFFTIFPHFENTHSLFCSSHVNRNWTRKSKWTIVSSDFDFIRFILVGVENHRDVRGDDSE